MPSKTDRRVGDALVVVQTVLAERKATIEALQAENAELRKPLLSYDDGGLPVKLPAWTPVDAERLEELEAAEAEVTTLRTALEEIDQRGKRHRHLLCIECEATWDTVREALHGRE